MESLISRALRSDILFAAWREAGQTNVGFIAQTVPEIRTKAYDGTNKPCFVIAPFNEGEESVFIQPDILFNSCQDVRVELPEVKYTRNFSAGTGIRLSEKEYLERLACLKKAMLDGQAEKVVFSRMEFHDVTAVDTAGIFTRLLEANPSAFVYLVNLPGGITWLGASPEVLLKEEDGMCRTMALAGTMQASGQGENWSGKELAEHTYVSNYIESVLRSAHCNFQPSDLTSRKLDSGLLHLCREFVFALPEECTFLNLAHSLHPTPAICGIPKDEAQRLIGLYEGIDRSFYTGFIGPYRLNGRSALYVNIRCACIAKGVARLFAGGGITTDSNPAAEWNETRLKLQTILKALNSQRKLQIFSE